MRDEDLKNLPQTIERWKFGELMEALGFKPGWENQTKSVELTYAGLEIVVYATDENGRLYMIPEEIEVQGPDDAEPMTIRGTGREAAVHEISIPFMGNWTKPMLKDVAARVSEICGHGWCRLAEGYEGDHKPAPIHCKAVGPDGMVCERTDGHTLFKISEEHAAHVDGVLHKW